ncbi:MAG: hypothetical protein JO240_05485 [Solirubrobacterales bacterium]|nr:hypothetical protein [Solirubrobacterales bacterium]
MEPTYSGTTTSRHAHEPHAAVGTLAVNRSPRPQTNLPPHVRAEVQRILDVAARRILDERMAAKPRQRGEEEAR